MNLTSIKQIMTQKTLSFYLFSVFCCCRFENNHLLLEGVVNSTFKKFQNINALLDIGLQRQLDTSLLKAEVRNSMLILSNNIGCIH